MAKVFWQIAMKIEVLISVRQMNKLLIALEFCQCLRSSLKYGVLKSRTVGSDCQVNDFWL